MSSVDGVRWQTHDMLTNRLAFDICYGNGRYLTGTENAILESPDGVNWSLASTNAPLRFPRFSFANGWFYAQGHRSADGVEWTRLNRRIGDLAAGNGQLVALEEYGDGKVWLSEDGVTWTNVFEAAGAAFVDVEFSEGLFFALTRTQVYVSLDGRRWSLSHDDRARPFSEMNRQIAHGSGVTVVTRFANQNWPWGGPFECYLSRSVDQINWSVVKVPMRSAEMVAYGNGRFVIASGEGEIATSADGANWTVIQPLKPFNLFAAAKGNDRAVVVGGGTFFKWLTAKRIILVSTNGTTWVDASANGDSILRDVAFTEGQFYAVGSNPARILASEDALDWKERYRTNDTRQLYGISSGHAGMVVVGTHGILHSTDGLLWRERTVPGAPNGRPYLYDVAYGDGRYVAVGGADVSSVATLLVSSNAIDWISIPVAPYRPFRGIVYGNGAFFAPRWYGPYYTSTNALDWRATDLGGGEVQSAYDSRVTYSGIDGASHIHGLFFTYGLHGDAWYSEDLIGWRKTSIPVDFFLSFKNHVLGISQDGRIARVVLSGGHHVRISSSGPISELGQESQVTISRSANIAEALRVPLHYGGTAEAGRDFEPFPAEIIINAGEASTVFTIKALKDSSNEDIEELALSLLPVEGYNLGPSASVMIPIYDASHTPRVRGVSIDGASMRLDLEVAQGSEYIVQESTDLKVWNPVTSFVAGSISAAASVPLQHQRSFYRVQPRPEHSE